MPIAKERKLQFNTAIITYPSDYDGLLTLQLIVEKFQSIINLSTKIVVAREDPDDEIQRVHYHLYWDDDKRKTITTNHFDIKLPEPVVVFIKQNGNRDYRLYSDISSQLGIDNFEEMRPKLDQYLEEEKENYVKWDYLDRAHPNIKLKKEYGDKYFMLRYVLKQKLLTDLKANFDIVQELHFLQHNCQQLCEKANELIEKELLKEIGINSVEELVDLLKRYKKRQDNKKKKELKRSQKSETKQGISIHEFNQKMLKIDEEIKTFKQFLREQILSKKMTKNEVIQKITKDPELFEIYSGSYLNYNKLISDMFRGRPPAKPTRHYEYKFWVPNKLYDYLMWLDDWVMKWYTGQPLEHRPKGLCLIGPSRTGKTTLLSLLGEFSYFKNVWNLDNWEAATAYTIMDDMDATDEGKGLSFSWFKPFFGAQDAITITDKFKPKQDIYNGKPLIWLNNYGLDETFKSTTAQDYIRKNMEIVYILKPLDVAPLGMEVFEYKQFDPTTTWYYNNVYKIEENKNQTTSVDDNQNSSNPNNTPDNWSCDNSDNNNLQFIDETEKIIEKCKEQYEEEESLHEKRKRILERNLLLEEHGRPFQRIRRSNSM